MTVKDKASRKRDKLTMSQESSTNVHNDSTLASLFASSAGPIVAPPKWSTQDRTKQTAEFETQKPRKNRESDINGSLPESSPVQETHKSRRKRKRPDVNEGLEDSYFQQLSPSKIDELPREFHETSAEKPRRSSSDEPELLRDDSTNLTPEDHGLDDDVSEDEDTPSHINGSIHEHDNPLHESLQNGQPDGELEKSSRTVFLGNVSSLAISSKSSYRTLLVHLSSPLKSLPSKDAAHKIESLRFRSTAYASSLPKKAAFTQKDLMDATTKSTNAYVVYSSQEAARLAAKRLNGTVVLDRHLRADLVAHPAKIDHRRCVFVGNLGFVDDETSSKTYKEDDSDDETGKKRRSSNHKPPGDVEEGLWREFGKVGQVESVRVVRDAKTRVGKGFAYVQFADENAVESALLYDGKMFAPLLPRKLRVSRAKRVKRNPPSTSQMGKPTPKGSCKRDRKYSPGQQSLLGRAGKLLGRAGAATMKRDADAGPSSSDSRKLGSESGLDNQKGTHIRAPETFVFEGHRARSDKRPPDLRFTKKGRANKGSKKLGGRSAKRAAAWKAGKSK
ncbi:MAG: Nucleolar protein 12 [Bogoriella megaspora]|nr:MAG: Nucleolar protein 12 [Bogoriella megaspora]